MGDSGLKKVSYLSKETTTCPVCSTEHNREEMLSGGGRLIAGKLTNELRRLYQESKKYGLIYPLAYAVQVCPKCLYSALPRDFNKLNEQETQALWDTTAHRGEIIDTFFKSLKFTEQRTLAHGAASMILAVDCYHLRSYSVAPTAKKAVSSLRAAWLLDDLYAFAPERPYDQLRDFYYMEAVTNYQKTLELVQNGQEPIEAEMGILGPDLDRAWGYDGVIYVNAYLTKKYVNAITEDPSARKTMLERSKRYLSKLYGSGKSSRSKPSALVDMSKDLYDEIGKMIEDLDNSNAS